MFKKTYFILLLVLAGLPATVISARASSPAHVAEIEVQRGEKWWGVFVSYAPGEPFMEPFEVNTSDWPISGFHVPVMLSSNGRYIWSSHPLDIRFDGEKITVGSDFEKVEVQRGGKNLREAYLVCLHKNFPPQGAIPDTTMFTLPLYDLSLEVGFRQTEDEILGYADKIMEHGLPAGVIVIPDGWASANNPYAFDRELYPDPDRMMASLHGKGFKVMLTVTPYAPAYGRAYVVGREQGLFLEDTHGDPVTITTRGGMAVCYDPGKYGEAIGLALDRLRSDHAVDGFRFDCRGALSVLGAQQKEAFMSSWLALGEGDAMCEYVPGGKEPVSSYVSGIVSGGALSADPSSEQRLVAALNDIVAAGLAGFPYCSVMPEWGDPGVLFADQGRMAKYLQFEALMPVMRIGFAPWRITDQALYKSVKEAVNLRMEMAGYMRELVDESARTAEPIVRHMEYQFPKAGFADCTDQFMIGPKYLFAPCGAGEQTRTVRLPKGVWNDREGGRHKGPMVMEVDCSDSRPVYFELVGNK